MEIVPQRKRYEEDIDLGHADADIGCGIGTEERNYGYLT